MRAGGVIPLICWGCRCSLVCPLVPEMMHRALVAWAKNVMAPTCGDFLPRCERGCLEDHFEAS